MSRETSKNVVAGSGFAAVQILSSHSLDQLQPSDVKMNDEAVSNKETKYVRSKSVKLQRMKVS